MKGLLCLLAVLCAVCVAVTTSFSESDTDMFRRGVILGRGPVPNQICAFGDSVFGFDCQNPPEDNQCLGVEFDGEYFYITGGGGTSTPEPNRLHFFDNSGNYLTSIDQPTTSGWGWRDIAYDGNHLYSSEGNTVAEWFVTGLPGSPVLNIVGEFPGPEDPNRALAYDPMSDHFYTANWSSDIYEFDRNGVVYGTWGNDYSIYGMAWDDISPDGPWMWIFAQEAPGAVIYQWDPTNHVYTGVSIDVTYAGSIAGGTGFTTDLNPNVGVLFCVHQSSPDAVVGYEIVSLCQPVEPPQMRSQGYWRRQCKDDFHEDICAYLDSVHAFSDLFDDFDCDAICDLMRVDPPERDMCRKARRQFMALLLNVASGKLAMCNCLDDGRIVGDIVEEIESLLSDSPERDDCEHAKTLADLINTGESVVPCSSPEESPPPGYTEPDPVLAMPEISGGRVVLHYELSSPQHVRLKIYDKTGRLVRKLVDEQQPAGSYQVKWDGLDRRGETVPSGICFSRLEAGRSVRTGKLMLLR